MEKKGAELSMNVIIIAVIALLVLVIIVYLVGNQVGLFDDGTKCVNAGGRCVGQGTCDANKMIFPQEEELCKPRQECCSLVPIR